MLQLPRATATSTWAQDRAGARSGRREPRDPAGDGGQSLRSRVRAVRAPTHCINSYLHLLSPIPVQTPPWPAPLHSCRACPGCPSPPGDGGDCWLSSTRLMAHVCPPYAQRAQLDTPGWGQDRSPGWSGRQGQPCSGASGGPQRGRSGFSVGKRKDLAACGSALAPSPCPEPAGPCTRHTRALRDRSDEQHRAAQEQAPFPAAPLLGGIPFCSTYRPIQDQAPPPTC